MNIFLFHFGRCGSTALASAVGQLPGFYWHGEIMSENTLVYDGFEKHPLSKKKGGGRFELSEFLNFISVAKDGIENQNGYHATYYGCEIKSYHFEWKYFQFSLDDSIRALSSTFAPAKFVFIRRRNSLRRILSANIARESGVYHVTTSMEKPSKISVDVNNFNDADLNCRGEITAVLSNSSVSEERYLKLMQECDGFEISYEDHIEPTMDGAMTVLNRELGIKSAPLRTHLKRTNPFPLAEIIVNYSEVRDRLNNTRFAWMLG